MTGAAIATIKYANDVLHPASQALLVVLSAVSTFTVIALLVSTVIHAFVLQDLFPNDLAIAISQRSHRRGRRRFHHRSSNAETKDIETGT